MEQYLLGVDIGTQTSKCILISREGRVIGKSSVEHATITPHAGWLEQDANEAWWGDFIRVTRNILDQTGIDPEIIAAIGISGSNPNVLPVDIQNLPLRPGILYVDSRAQSQTNYLDCELGGGQSKFRLHVLAEILWLQENEPELWKKTYKILGTPGFIVNRLTGTYTMERGYPILYDTKFGTWDADMCQRFNVPIELLPDIHSPVDVVGKVTREAADQTGLAEGTPVICGGADGYSELLSTALADENEGTILYATGMYLGRLKTGNMVSPFPINNPSFPEHYHAPQFIGLGMATSGALTRWFRDNFASDEINEEKRTGTSAYKLIEIEASKIPPGSEGLVVLPYFNGERVPINDPDARGLILGLTLRHTRFHIYHALLEGIAYGLRHVIDILAESNVKPPARLRAAGGGSQNELWTQILSDITGIPQDCVKGNLGAPLGDAFMAAVGVGIFPDFKAISNWVKIKRVVQPREQYKTLYDRYYKVYRNLYAKNAVDMHEVSRLSYL